MTTASPMEGDSAAQSGLYYRHSGKAPPVSLLIALIGGAVVALPAAMLYALGDIYIPIIYASFLLAIGMGVVLGGVPAWLLRAGKVRSTFLSTIVVIVVAAFGYYAIWVAW